MKKTAQTVIKVVICFCLLICCVVVVGASVSQDIGTETHTIEKYEYPITPYKTPEKWKEFSSHTQMLEACEIPEDILESMTTEELLLACFDYPLAGDAFCYSSSEIGFEAVKANFNGLAELFERNDLSSALVNYYSGLDVCSFSEAEQMSFKTNFICSLTEYAEKSGVLSAEDALSISNDCDRISSELPTFKRTLADLSQKSAAYDGYVLIEGIKFFFNNTTVKTPKGSTVSGYKFVSDLPDDLINKYENYVSDFYPDATILRDPTVFYNCHSYAWYSTSSSNNVWINDPSRYMSDNSYTLIGSYSNGSSGFL